MVSQDPPKRPKGGPKRYLKSSKYRKKENVKVREKWMKELKKRVSDLENSRYNSFSDQDAFIEVEKMRRELCSKRAVVGGWTPSTSEDARLKKMQELIDACASEIHNIDKKQ